MKYVTAEQYWVLFVCSYLVLTDEYVSILNNATSSSNASVVSPQGVVEVGTDEASAPPAAAPAAQAPPAPIVQAPVLPVVEWLQWGVMARLILVAFLFTYNRNLNTEKLAHMAGKM